MRLRVGDIELGTTPSGQDGPILVRSLSPAGAEVRTRDNPRLGRDGVVPGRDFLGGATWAIELSTNARYATEAREIYSRLQAIWHDPEARKASGKLIPLDYEVNGTHEWRRVYGRPRSFDPPTGDVLMLQGRADFGCEFEVLDPRFFSGADEGLHEHTLTHFGEMTGGIYAPVAAPVATRGTSGSRAGALVNAGTVHTPVHVVFYGPIEDARIRSGTGWEVGFNGSLLYDERVEIDPMAHTVTLYDGDGVGRPAFSRLTRRSQLSEIGIPPGLTNVFFSGIDPTHSSRAVIQWRDAYQSF